MMAIPLCQQSRAAAGCQIVIFSYEQLRAVIPSPLTCRFPSVEIAKSFLVATDALLAAEKK